MEISIVAIRLLVRSCCMFMQSFKPVIHYLRGLFDFGLFDFGQTLDLCSGRKEGVRASFRSLESLGGNLHSRYRPCMPCMLMEMEMEMEIRGPMRLCVYP